MCKTKLNPDGILVTQAAWAELLGWTHPSGLVIPMFSLGSWIHSWRIYRAIWVWRSHGDVSSELGRFDEAESGSMMIQKELGGGIP